MPAALGQEAQQTVRLGHVVWAEPGGRIGGRPPARGGEAIVAQPGLDQVVGFTVLVESDGEGHVNSAVDEFRLLEFRHALVPAEKLAGAQVRAVFERRHALGADSAGGGLPGWQHGHHTQGE